MENTTGIKLRTIFMGTSDFSANILESILANGYNIVGVYTKPDSANGRKKELAESPVKKLAEKNNLPVFTPTKFTDETIEEMKKIKPDLIIVAAYGKILPKKILEIPGFGCINVHPSLLPEFRGPSPIQNALLLGKKETGTTIMLMDAGMDTGDIIAQEKIQINDHDMSEELSERLSKLSADLLIQTIEPWVSRKIEPRKQDSSKATLCQLIEREDGRIIWEQDAQNIYNRFRAFHPWPGIFTFWKNGESILRIKLLKISLQRSNPGMKHSVGEIFELGESIGVQTLDGVIILEEVQPEGRNPMSIKDFSNGYPKFIGSILF